MLPIQGSKLTFRLKTTDRPNEEVLELGQCKTRQRVVRPGRPARYPETLDGRQDDYFKPITLTIPASMCITTPAIHDDPYTAKTYICTCRGRTTQSKQGSFDYGSTGSKIHSDLVQQASRLLYSPKDAASSDAREHLTEFLVVHGLSEIRHFIPQQQDT
ncbi:hypothetical protein B0O80DRAFT_504666 [Mortierella sp. GBAus27b]|nr:hypothetical protein B0O80DRAFT_504666 [Mortierella sp. GBAus27b]